MADEPPPMHFDDIIAKTGEAAQTLPPLTMPIEQAMQKVVSGEGLPAKTKQAPGKLSDYAIGIPTASSSGRETVKLQ